jgi:hypothetical protein
VSHLNARDPGGTTGYRETYTTRDKQGRTIDVHQVKVPRNRTKGPDGGEGGGKRYSSNLS